MSTCQSRAQVEEYNLPLHIGAIFIILIVSAGACALPIIAVKVPRLRIPTRAHFVFRHFGTGVLVATAFVHLFPTAFISLTDPCLPPFFNETFPAFAGAIALAAVFVIMIVEMTLHPGSSMCSGILAETSMYDRRVEVDLPYSTAQCSQTRSSRSSNYPTALQDRCVGETQVNAAMPTTHALEDYTADDQPPVSTKRTESERKKLAMQCMLLEGGILFHSIFIGMALAVSVGREQIILIIAIVFHQTFEGLALGSRIAAIGWKTGSLQPWLMATAYGCTTPLGQGIGIATRKLYDPGSETGLIVVGTMNAISAGLLTFASLVDLLSEDFLTEHSWTTLTGNRRMIAMSLVLLGAFCMSLIGAWA